MGQFKRKMARNVMSIKTGKGEGIVATFDWRISWPRYLVDERAVGRLINWCSASDLQACPA
jgi:hypothetical protein